MPPRKKNLKNRPYYLAQLIGFQDTEPVKVITGMRRCGKSSLLQLMQQHLMDSGVTKNRIIAMNFESLQYQGMTYKEFYTYVAHKIKENEERFYLFFDELQYIRGWEHAINSFRIDFDCDIYITGSNSYLLSSEYSTYLAGRYVEIKVYPLSFREFVDFHGYKLLDYVTPLGTTKKSAEDMHGDAIDLRDLFDAYIRYGGMPGIADVGLEQSKAMTLLDGIYSTVVVRDILERENRAGIRQVTNAELLRKITLFLADNVGNTTSLNSISKTLMNERLIPYSENPDVRRYDVSHTAARQNACEKHQSARTKSTSQKVDCRPAVQTVASYVEALKQSYLFYEVKRFDIKGKDYLKTLGKYYIADIGLRNYLLGFRNGDVGHILENIVYFELLRRGYDVAIGKIENLEVDFVATSTRNTLYVQVTESMTNNDVKLREIKPLQKIRNNYQKLVLTLDQPLEEDYQGILIVNLIEWLSSE